MLGWLLLRFLPRRLLPLLAVYEVVKIARRLRGAPNARPPARIRLSGDPVMPVVVDEGAAVQRTRTGSDPAEGGHGGASSIVTPDDPHRPGA